MRPNFKVPKSLQLESQALRVGGTSCPRGRAAARGGARPRVDEECVALASESWSKLQLFCFQGVEAVLGTTVGAVRGLLSWMLTLSH